MKKILTFTASWCGPCKMLKPILAKLAEEKKIIWENHDIDENKELAAKFNVKSVPTMFFYNEDGSEGVMASGYMAEEKILKLYGYVEKPAEAIQVVEEVVVEEAIVEEVVVDEVVVDEVVEDFIIEDVIASEDSEEFLFTDEDFAALPDADEVNEGHPELDGAAELFGTLEEDLEVDILADDEVKGE